jgi:catechol 2,3-dioxygenase-like lactoylglutathione lyase family enzyme
MPPVTRILETALYVDDVPRVVAFYRDVLGLRALDDGERLVPMDAGQGTVLLIFSRGATVTPAETPGGRIPPHDGHGPVHLAFAVPADSLREWERHLEQHGIAIESRVRWPRGGDSVYVRDPAGHSVELATPGTWAVY